MPKFEFCLDAIAVCSKIVRDKIFQEIFPELHLLCCIALLFHLQQPGQREDFPLCAVLKINSVTGCLM